MKIGEMTISLGLVERVQRLARHARQKRALSGDPCPPWLFPGWWLADRLRYGPLGHYIAHARRIPGWTRGAEAVALAQCSYALPADAVIVEIGSFLGGSTVLLAGGRALRGNGSVYAIDPFDASGEAFSAPIYQQIRGGLRESLRQRFERNLRAAGVAPFVQVRQGRAHEVAATWNEAIDLLFLDGDQSRQGVRLAYESWAPFLKPQGQIAVHNSRRDPHSADHDGHWRLVEETLRTPAYTAVACIGSTTFARRVGIG